jgi:hypothetical protein
MASTAQTLDVRTLGGIYSRCQLAGAGGAIAQGTQAIAFLDPLNGNTNSGLTQTRADSNFFDGMVPQGEVYTLFSLEAQIFESDGAGNPVLHTNIILQQALRNLSFSLILKGQEYNIGSLMTVPSPKGTNTAPQNGGRAVAPFRFPRQLALQLRSNDQFAVRTQAQRAITTGGGGNGLLITWHAAASRGIPLGQLSGA